MAAKDLRKLSRTELLELLLEQRKENEILRTQLAEAQEQIARTQITIEKSGSIAEAALLLNGVFEAAEAACLQYVDNVCRRYDEVLEAEKAKARRIAEAAESVKQELLYDSSTKNADEPWAPGTWEVHVNE